MGAGTYLLVMSLATLAWCILVRLRVAYDAPLNGIVSGLPGFLLIVATTLFGVLFFALSVRRLKDLNFPGWTVNLLAIPLFAVIVLPLLCGLSGPRWDNDYGTAPEPSSWRKIAIAFLAFVLAFNFAYTTGIEYFAFRRSLTAPDLQPISQSEPARFQAGAA